MAPDREMERNGTEQLLGGRLARFVKRATLCNNSPRRHTTFLRVSVFCIIRRIPTLSGHRHVFSSPLTLPPTEGAGKLLVKREDTLWRSRSARNHDSSVRQSGLT